MSKLAEQLIKSVVESVASQVRIILTQSAYKPAQWDIDDNDSYVVVTFYGSKARYWAMNFYSDAKSMSRAYGFHRVERPEQVEDDEVDVEVGR